MGSIMFLILINLICIGNNEGIHNEVQWANSPALTLYSAGFNPQWPIPREGRLSAQLGCTMLGWLWLQPRLVRTGKVKGDKEIVLPQHTPMQTPFPLPPHPCSWYSWRTGAEGGGNLFLGKQLQALAVCARVLLPKNLVWSIISPDKKMRSAFRELGVLGLQGWAWDGSPLTDGASRALSQSPLKVVTRTSAGRLNGTWDEAGVDHSQSSELE